MALLASCSANSIPDPVASSTSEERTTSQEAPTQSETRALNGLQWGDGTPIEATVLDLGSAQKPAFDQVSGRHAHDLPAGEELIGVLPTGRALVLRDGLPYRIETSGEYQLFWPAGMTSPSDQASSWSVHDDGVMAIASDDAGKQTVSYYSGDGNDLQVLNMEGQWPLAVQPVVFEERLYWSEPVGANAEVRSRPLDGSEGTRTEVKDATGVYKTKKGLAVLTNHDGKGVTDSKIAGMQSLEGTVLFSASKDFEFAGIGGDGSPWTPQEDGSAISFLMSEGRTYTQVVLNLETQRAWAMDLPEGRVPYGSATSGLRVFVVWSPEKQDELGQLGNRGVVLDARTGNLSAFTPKNKFGEIFANDKALAWTTVTEAGKKSFASEILK